MISILPYRHRIHVQMYATTQVQTYVLRLIVLTIAICTLTALDPYTIAQEPKAAESSPHSPTTALIYNSSTKNWISAHGSAITVWDEACQKPAKELSTNCAKIHDLKFNDNGSQLIVVGGEPGENGLIEQYTWPEFQLLAKRQIPGDTFLRVDWNVDNSAIAVASLAGTLLLLEAQGLVSRWEVDAHPNGCTAVQIFPSAKLVASGGNDSAIRLWNLETGAPVRSLAQHTAGISQLLSTPNNFSKSSQMVSLSRDQTVRLWDPQTGRLIRFTRLAAVPVEAQWELDPQSHSPMLWVLCEDGRLRRIDLKTTTIEQDIQGSLAATFAIGQRGSNLFVAGISPQPLLIPVRPPLQRIKVANAGPKFVTERDAQEFRVKGFNYDHDSVGRLIEDYWNEQWTEIENDFCEMQELGANTVRVHLQFGKFMRSSTEPDPQALAKFSALVQLAERTRLYLDVTGLGCYHKKDVPNWYDALSETERWEAQANFWQAVVKAAHKSPAIFCWDLMNEPVVPGGKRNAGDWLGPAFGDKHFVQCIALDQANRPRPEIAKAWTKKLANAIRATGDPALVTVGLVDWSLNRPGLTSGFEPDKIAEHVDFIAMHLYPKSDQLEKDAETLRGFRVGKPVIIEECFPLRCNIDELRKFLNENAEAHEGWISFYWGSTPQELADQKTLPAAITREWLLNLP